MTVLMEIFKRRKVLILDYVPQDAIHSLKTRYWNYIK